MKKTFFFILLMIVSFQVYAGGNLHRRLQINLECKQAATCDNVLDLIAGAQGIKQSDKWTDEDRDYKKNIDADKIPGKDKDGQDTSFINAVYLFKDDVSAEDIYTKLKDSIPVGVAGTVSLHFCPIEGSIHDGWRGCHDDPRADYKELIF